MKPNFLERRKYNSSSPHRVHYPSVDRFDGLAKGSAECQADIAPQAHDVFADAV